MVKLKDLPPPSVIKAFKGKIDYAVMWGIPYARKWPRPPGAHTPQGVRMAQLRFAWFMQTAPQRHSWVTTLWSGLPGPKGWTWRDRMYAYYSGGHWPQTTFPPDPNPPPTQFPDPLNRWWAISALYWAIKPTGFYSLVAELDVPCWGEMQITDPAQLELRLRFAQSLHSKPHTKTRRGQPIDCGHILSSSSPPDTRFLLPNFWQEDPSITQYWDNFGQQAYAKLPCYAWFEPAIGSPHYSYDQPPTPSTGPFFFLNPTVQIGPPRPGYIRLYPVRPVTTRHPLRQPTFITPPPKVLTHARHSFPLTTMFDPPQNGSWPQDPDPYPLLPPW